MGDGTTRTNWIELLISGSHHTRNVFHIVNAIAAFKESVSVSWSLEAGDNSLKLDQWQRQHMSITPIMSPTPSPESTDSQLFGTYGYSDTLERVYYGPGSIKTALPKLLLDLGVRMKKMRLVSLKNFRHLLRELSSDCSLLQTCVNHSHETCTDGLSDQMDVIFSLARTTCHNVSSWRISFPPYFREYK